MEGNGTETNSAGDALSGPGFDGNGFDNNEEALLLQMMETNNDPVSPNLQALLDNRVDLGWPSGQRQQSPLFMERPQSPGVDTAEFSFAKPAQTGKPFSLQPLPKRPPVDANQDVSGPEKIVEDENSGDERADQAK